MIEKDYKFFDGSVICIGCVWVCFGHLKEKLSILNAAAIAAVIHSAFHGSIATFPGLFIVFVLFAYLYKRTGSIWAPCLAHGIHNFIVMCIAYGHSFA